MPPLGPLKLNRHPRHLVDHLQYMYMPHDEKRSTAFFFEIGKTGWQVTKGSRNLYDVYVIQN